MATFYVVFEKGGSPLFDDGPQDGGDCTSVPVRVADQRAAEAIKHLLALGSYDVSLALAATFSAGFSTGKRELTPVTR